jgi:hypothetical protein
VRQENSGDVLQHVSMKHNKKIQAQSSSISSKVNGEYNTSCWNFTQGIM